MFVFDFLEDAVDCFMTMVFGKLDKMGLNRFKTQFDFWSNIGMLFGRALGISEEKFLEIS